MQAKYDGTCQRCGKPISAGDQIERVTEQKYSRGRLVDRSVFLHAACADDYRRQIASEDFDQAQYDSL